MFGFGKKKEREQEKNGQEKRQKAKIDKLVMGAIIGVAVGSVVGMAMAPKKGTETRKIIAEKGKEAFEKGKEISHSIFQKNKKKGVLERTLGILFKKKKAKNNPLKEIPGEAIENEEFKIL
jgi:gas vesicle protein